MKKPELKCKGCKGRDKMIETLSKRIDELEKKRPVRRLVDAAKVVEMF